MAIRSYTYDNSLLFKDSAAQTSSGAWQVSAANKIIDTNNGASGNPSRFEGVMVCDISAIDTVTGDEYYNLLIQASSSSSFASNVFNVGGTLIGGASVAGVPTVVPVGRVEIKFSNEFQGTVYRYLRGYTVIGGTTPTITFAAFAAIDFAGAC